MSCWLKHLLPAPHRQPDTRAVYKVCSAVAGSHSWPQALLALSFQEWILCDDKWTLLMEVTFVLNFHLRLSGCICSFLHAALCFRVLISLVLVLTPLPGCSSCRWLYWCESWGWKAGTGTAPGRAAGFGNLGEPRGFVFSCALVPTS